MNLLSGFTLLFLVAVVCCQSTNPGNFVPRLTIDDFRLGDNSVVVFTNRTLPASESSVYTDPGNPTNLLGGERDLELTVETATGAAPVSASVGDGTWAISTPNSASGTVNLQFDGKDASTELAVGGLGSVDFTLGGSSQAFNISLETDIATEYNFFIYSPNGNRCDYQVSIPDGEGITRNFYLPFADFGGNCDFTNVGAAEILVEAFNNVDAVCKFFGTVGEPITPSPRPSGTPTPSPIVEVCLCQCPAFTCAIDFDLDDDENDAFYFDDDDNGAGASGNGEEVSPASILSVSMAAILLVVAFIY